MLFYSFEFLLLFLPITLICFYWVGRRFGGQAAVPLLVIASLIFYASGNPMWVVALLTLSVVYNYFLGRWLQSTQSKALFLFAIISNLCLLGYFKYVNFFLDIADGGTDKNWHIESLILPLGISFYTFQQIVWLVDSYTKVVTTKAKDFWRYALFVTFFPHLVAGPIVAHTEVMPQFSKNETFIPRWSSLAIGLSIFIIGLTKKVVIADEFATSSSPVFSSAADGLVDASSAWLAALCYTFQIYFDFSGYSDMAVGLARMFNIRLPMNFNSPFKSPTLIELWKRWHMTMTRFFNSYVYTPISLWLLRLQVRRKIKSNAALYVSTFITLLAVGFWHGANWTFIIFGAMQGIGIIANYLWRDLRKKFKTKPLPHILSVGLTYVFFMLSCVIYRSETLEVAGNMYRSMFAPNIAFGADFRLEKLALWLGGAIICFLLPNTQQIMQNYAPVLDAKNIKRLLRTEQIHRICWRPNVAWCLLLVTMSLLSINILLDANKVQEFIYFQF